LSAREDAGGVDDDEPLPAPIPGPEFRRLSRRQSIVAWTLGWLVGLMLATAAILVLVLR